MACAVGSVVLTVAMIAVGNSCQMVRVIQLISWGRKFTMMYGIGQGWGEA